MRKVYGNLPTWSIRTRAESDLAVGAHESRNPQVDWQVVAQNASSDTS